MLPEAVSCARGEPATCGFIGHQWPQLRDFAALQPGVAGPSAATWRKLEKLITAVASGQELGDLFEYKLKDRVTLKKNQSGVWYRCAIRR